jgi:hypothetical protein
LVVVQLVESSSSRCLAAVALQQPAGALLAADVAERKEVVLQIAAFRFRRPRRLVAVSGPFSND